MPLPLVILSLFMLLLNLALTWMPYLLVLVAGIEFLGNTLELEVKIFTRWDTA
jgi:hypothetical protein